MPQLITLSILGVCIAAGLVLCFVALVLALLGSPVAHTEITSGPTRGRGRNHLLGAVLAAALLSATWIVAKPAALDPLCDYFDWFGAETAQAARHYAYVANAPIGRPLAVSSR